MIDDLDRTIALLIKRGLPPAFADQVNISFAAPDDSFPPPSVSLPAVNLFLYDMRENVELRQTNWEVSRSELGDLKRTPPAKRIDCSYLVTAWVKQSATQPLDEHRLLSEVMKVLLHYPTIPAEVLQGEIEGQLPLLPTATLHTGTLQSPGEFWQALGGKLKAAFHYTVTFSVDPLQPAELGPPVHDKYIKIVHGA